MVYKQKLRVLLPCGKSDKLETGTDFILLCIKVYDKYRSPWFMGKIRNMKKALIRSEEELWFSLGWKSSDCISQSLT